MEDLAILARQTAAQCSPNRISCGCRYLPRLSSARPSCSFLGGLYSAAGLFLRFQMPHSVSLSAILCIFGLSAWMRIGFN